MRISAQQLCQSTWCIARDCGDDAEPSGYCRRHERSRRRGVEVPLHRVTQPRAPNPATELWCSTCQNWLPDEAFPRQAASKATPRRNRNTECRACAHQRRKRDRAAETPETHLARILADRARRAKKAQQ